MSYHEQNNINIIVLYHSRHGTTQQLARHIARGVASIPQCQATLRTVPEIDSGRAVTPSDPIIDIQELKACHGLAVGSPVWFGNMSAAMKHFWDQTTSLWVSGNLIDKPACVFTSSSSPHGGQETTLQSMTLPLFHHGMLVMGIPYSEPNLHSSFKGGTPYGASSVSKEGHANLDKQVAELAFSQGQRLARVAVALQLSTLSQP
ncbi:MULTISPECIES: NAD(P)H:quinone oxidoreductase [Vibrio]|uniref:NAD(P)H:quinone oxidoreductase n=1 Tax=Vibrio casei TaxID=673372 RepID=A0A368LLZ1_9VIBR|nr:MULTISPECIES: NAD(P)H:quinone oxidoreductase [Vibrio]RCS72815.1 NAD(P)H:quinone oxidoreductase [Vibrio casei]SJN39010.1 Flavoprotein WrbA [Vibrio casei]HBV74884.1 NAD(P)H:quinone oxidoreductase [Vibrio sp.]